MQRCKYERTLKSPAYDKKKEKSSKYNNEIDLQEIWYTAEVYQFKKNQEWFKSRENTSTL